MSTDLFGVPLVTRPKIEQLRLGLGMGRQLRWGETVLTVSLDSFSGSMGLSAVDLPDLGPRWAKALVVLYPGRRPGEVNAKEAASDLGVDPRTVEGYAQGQIPRADVLWCAFRRHGRRLLVTLAPELAPPSEHEILRAADALRQASTALADQLCQLKGGRHVV